MAHPATEDLPSELRRPSSSAFKQQKLPAWQPILTAGSVMPVCLVVGLAFLPIGIGLLMSSADVQEKEIDYTNCSSVQDPSHRCAELLTESSGSSCQCTIDFHLNYTMKPDVYAYYALTHFHQNFRRYVKSRDDTQLLGQISSQVSIDCEPFEYFQNDTSKLPYLPCGAVANSMFNDSFRVQHKIRAEDENWTDIGVLRKGIAWWTDKQSKFRNPPNIPEAIALTAPPSNWKKNVFELDPEDQSNTGLLNEDFIVWMRVAALPNFRKLYRRVNHTVALFADGLPAHYRYRLLVEYNYPVVQFGGTKRFILANTSWLGGRNPFLGIAYVAVGALCILLAGLFLVLHNKFESGDLAASRKPRTHY